METRTVVYVGPHTEVDVLDQQHVDRLGNTFYLEGVERAKPVDVPADVAERLLQQVGNWDTPKKTDAKVSS